MTHSLYIHDVASFNFRISKYPIGLTVQIFSSYNDRGTAAAPFDSSLCDRNMVIYREPTLNSSPIGSDD